MLKHELMPDGDDRRTVVTRERVERGDRLEEIQDDIRFRLAHDIVELLHDAAIFGKIAKDAEERGGVADGLAVLIFELQRRQLPDRRLHGRREEFRHLPVCAHAQRDGDELMSGRLDHFLHGHRLRHVAPSLAQHAKHYSHESELV